MRRCRDNDLKIAFMNLRKPTREHWSRSIWRNDGHSSYVNCINKFSNLINSPSVLYLFTLFTITLKRYKRFVRVTLATGNDLTIRNKFGISLRKQRYVLNVSIRAHRFHYRRITFIVFLSGESEEC